MTFTSILDYAKHGLILSVLLSCIVFAGSTLALTPRQLVEIVDFDTPLVSPDGGWVAFRTEQASIERNTYDTVWYVQDLNGTSSPRRVADGGVPLRDTAGISVPTSVVWSPDGRWIYYRALIDGKIDVWRAAADGSGAEAITSDPADVQSFWLSSNGQVLKYLVGGTREDVFVAEQAEYDRGIRIDRAAPLGQNLFRSGYTEGRPATQRLGLVFNRVPLPVGPAPRWKAISLVTRETQDLTPSNAPPVPLAASDLGVESADISRVVQDSRTGRVALLRRVVRQFIDSLQCDFHRRKF